jgi:xanthine dehydrogenase molybdopterin-binding subunit B
MQRDNQQIELDFVRANVLARDLSRDSLGFYVPPRLHFAEAINRGAVHYPFEQTATKCSF